MTRSRDLKTEIIIEFLGHVYLKIPGEISKIAILSEFTLSMNLVYKLRARVRNSQSTYFLPIKNESLKSQKSCGMLKKRKFAFFGVCTHIWTPLLLCLHSYMDLFFDVCTHIWTFLCSSLHLYLDAPATEFALIFGPTRDQVCTHIWTHLL